MQHVAGDTDDPLDQALPLGFGHDACGAEYLGRAGFMPIATLGNRSIAAFRIAGSTMGFDLLQQGRLVIL
jgi:hypothetical protein